MPEPSVIQILKLDRLDRKQPDGWHFASEARYIGPEHRGILGFKELFGVEAVDESDLGLASKYLGRCDSDTGGIWLLLDACQN